MRSTSSILFFLILICSCNVQETSKNSKSATVEEKASDKEVIDKIDEGNFESFFIHTAPKIEEQISPFIRRIFQDSKGNFWLGTNGDGVVRYQPNKKTSNSSNSHLDYFSIEQGFAGLAVRSILEDVNGIIWFGTERGLSSFDGASFNNYTTEDGLINNDIWAMAFDSRGQLWIGTYGGVSIFNGSIFTDFQIPESESDPNRGVSSKKIIHSIFEDSKGQMWFGTNSGAYFYDGSILINISEKEGLCNNAVNDILEDRSGSF